MVIPFAIDTAYYAPGFRVEINGAELAADISKDIMDVTVTHSLDAADMCTLKVNNQGLKWIDSTLFAEGGEVKVYMGYHPGQFPLMISGEITALEPVFPEGGVPTLTVQVLSRFHRLTRETHARSFSGKTDSQIAEWIAEEMNLQADVEDSQVTHAYVFQNNQTNLDFLEERARRIGYEVRVDDRTLMFRRARTAASKVYVLEWGKTLKSFQPRLSTVHQVSRVVVKGWNPETREEIEGIAERGDEETTMSGARSGSQISEEAFGITAEKEIVNRAIRSVEEANRIALAHFNRLALSFITGTAACIGVPEIRAGEVIELKGLGERFSGLYYITSSTHSINDSGYLVTFQVRRNAA